MPTVRDDADVAAFLEALQHPHKTAILALRSLILSADERIGEGIKWNVPSFRTSEWFATLHLRAKRGVGVILHFGAKKSAISQTGVAIADPTGLLEWLGKDRASVLFADIDDIQTRQDAFVALLREWIGHV